jgi:hypothetical protein
MTKPRKKQATAPGFDPAALDALLGERRTIGEVDELFRQMKKALMERARPTSSPITWGTRPAKPSRRTSRITATGRPPRRC